MHSVDLEKFSNIFLFHDGDRPVVKVSGQPDRQRGKRPHTKSKNGCLACKKRRVKCDEGFPCGHCINRHERCERRNNDLVSPKIDQLQQPSSSSQHIWDTLLQASFQTEYLMRAILSLAAKHLSILRPQDPRYAEAAILLLSKSTRLFRESLSTPMTADTCDALVGTSVLINYMAWTDLGFLDGQRILECPEEGGLDMSGDLLFLLGSGVHQVFSSSFHVFHENHSVFIKVAQYHPCEKLEKEADRRGTAWRDTMERLVALFDDPRYVGSSPNTSVDDAPESPPEPCSLDCKSPPACTHIMQCRESLDNDQHDLEGNIQGAGDDTRNIPNFDPCPTARAIYERLARRISVILALIPPEGEIGNSTPPLPRSRLYDSQRYFYVFPTLCCGSFRPLITQGDSRALIILHHTYRAARRLSQIEETWWAGRRAVAMERLTLLELHARGLSAEI